MKVFVSFYPLSNCKHLKTSQIKMLSLPREILYLLPLPLRTSINLSRTCKWIHTRMNPFTIKHTYVDGVKDYTIYQDKDYIITYKDGLYDVCQNIDIILLEHVFKKTGTEPPYIHRGVDSIYKLDKEIFSILVDGKRLQRTHEYIISNGPTPSYRIRLPYKDAGYWKLPAIYNIDKYYRIYVEDELALDIAYNAAIQGKQVDICITHLDQDIIDTIKQNNYINNLHNIRLIEKVEDNNYDLVISNDPEVVKLLMSELHNTDIIMFFDRSGLMQVSQVISKYKSILYSNRVIQVFESKYACIVYKHYLSIDYDMNLNKFAIDLLPEYMTGIIVSMGLFICPSCFYIGDNLDVIKLMEKSSRVRGVMWEKLWDKYDSLSTNEQ